MTVKPVPLVSQDPESPFHRAIEDDVPVADRPLVRLLAERRLWPIFLFRAMSLQGSHPTIMIALEQHSKSFTDPSRRAANTLAYAYRIYFGENVAESARELREMHRPITGTDYEGRKYHAWNREVWTWVHLTTVEALLYAMDACFGRQSVAETAAFYQASRRLGILYGVRPEDMPVDIEGLRRYVEAGVEDKLAMSPGTRKLQQLVDEQAVLPLLNPVFAALPSWVQAVGDRLTARPLQTLMYGTFPEYVRRLWDVEWSRARQREFEVLIAVMRVGSRLVPERLRWVPEARVALGR